MHSTRSLLGYSTVVSYWHGTAPECPPANEPLSLVYRIGLRIRIHVHVPYLPRAPITGHAQPISSNCHFHLCAGERFQPSPAPCKYQYSNTVSTVVSHDHFSVPRVYLWMVRPSVAVPRLRRTVRHQIQAKLGSYIHPSLQHSSPVV